MRSHLSLRSLGRNWRKAVLGTGVVGVAVASFCCGRSASVPEAQAAPPAPVTARASENTPPVVSEPPSDYSRRVVAYMYGTIPITREELGEYLIARFGAERLELFVNNRIIQHACQQKGITVTEAEIEAHIAETLKGFGPTLNRKDFEEQILKPRHLTMFEWKEDVIRPKLLMTKLCRPQLRVTEEDFQKAFEAYYGEKVQCKMIMWPKTEKNKVLTDIYAKIQANEDEFNRVAKSQASHVLAAKEGDLEHPIGHHTTGSDDLEKEAFSLRPGELSRVFDAPDGSVVVLKCIKRIPADSTKILEQERPRLEKEIIDKKVEMEIPKVFQELRAQADPKPLLVKALREEDLVRDVKKEMETGPGKPAKSALTQPRGN